MSAADIAYRHDRAIITHNNTWRPVVRDLRSRRLALSLADARANVAALAAALEREILQTQRLADDLARARESNTQAEKVRDENDRLRGAITTALKHAGTDPRTPEFTVFDTPDVEKLRGLVR